MIIQLITAMHLYGHPLIADVAVGTAHPTTITALALLLVGSVGLNCALLLGFMSWRGGATPPNAALRGAAAFGSVLGLGLALLLALKLI
jgi:hypothetical protein